MPGPLIGTIQRPSCSRHTAWLQANLSLVPTRRRNVYRCCCVFTAQDTARDQELRSRLSRTPIHKSDLRDPATIGSTHSMAVSVEDEGEQLALQNYMTLPVEQYHNLDKDMIRPLGGNRFALTVPRVELLGVWVEPLVEVVVTSTPSKVILQATNCRVHGSDLVQRLNLDQRFCIMFRTELQWVPGMHAGNGLPSPHASHANGQQSPANQGWFRNPFASSGQQAADGQMKGCLKAAAELQVHAEVITPFNLMPRSLLQSSGSAVMAALLRSLLPLFLSKLSDDYRRWATNPAYRRQRASRQPARSGQL